MKINRIIPATYAILLCFSCHATALGEDQRVINGTTLQPDEDPSRAILLAVPRTSLGFKDSPSNIKFARDKRRSQIIANLERCSLSGSASTKLTFAAEGRYPHFLSGELNRKDPDTFYFQQSVWDECPLRESDIEPNSVTLDSNIFSSQLHCCADSIIPKEQNVATNLVMIHIIPPRLSRQFPSLITAKEIHSPMNLRLINLIDVPLAQLEEFEKRRVDYFSHNFQTSLQIEQAQRALAMRFNALFCLPSAVH